MLLGNRPANCNQAQMYLRTQMVRTFSNISSFLSRWYSETARLVRPVSIFTECVFLCFLTTCDFFIFNQLATCLSLLFFAFLLLAYSNPRSHGGCSSIRPPCCHLLLLFTYLLSGTNFARHKIRITRACHKTANIIDFRMSHTVSMSHVAKLKDMWEIRKRMWFGILMSVRGTPQLMAFINRVKVAFFFRKFRCRI